VVSDGITFVFKGDNYYQLNEYGNRILPGYPKPIRSRWPDVLTPVDTVLYFEPTRQTENYGQATSKPSALYFFKGNSYWKYESTDRPVFGNAQLIRNGFPGIPDNLDSSFTWSKDGQVYFTKGTQYYRYTRGVGADAGYPRSLPYWSGIPSRIDSAVKWTNGQTYFFVGNQYYRFNDATNRVDAGGFPRLTGCWWLGCPSPTVE